MGQCVCLHHRKLESYLYMGPLLLGRIAQRIRSGLIFLQEAKVLPEKDLTESYVNQMKYEVRFLIAYYYSLMIELYGAIPFTPGVLVSVDAPESEMMTSQRPYAEV